MTAKGQSAPVRCLVMARNNRCEADVGQRNSNGSSGLEAVAEEGRVNAFLCPSAGCSLFFRGPRPGAIFCDLYIAQTWIKDLPYFACSFVAEHYASSSLRSCLGISH